MPRTSATKANSASIAVNPQETFRYTTPEIQTVGGGLNAYAQITPKNSFSGSAETFLKALNGIESFAKEYRQEKRKEDLVAGQAAAAKGEGIASDASKDFAEGYYAFAGTADAVEFKNIIHQDMETALNEGWTPTEWQAHMGMRQMEFIQGKPDQYILPFAKAALDVEDQYTSQFVNKQRALIMEGVENNISKTIRGLVDNRFASGKDADTVMDELRGDYDSQLALAKKAGVAEDRFAAMFVQDIGERAAQAGRPDILNMFYRENQDGSTLADNPEVEKMVTEYRDKAYTTMRSQEVAREKAQKEADENTQRQIVMKLDEVMDLPASQRGVALQQMENIVKANAKHMSPTFLASNLKDLRDLSDLGGFARVSTPEILAIGKAQAERGELPDGFLGRTKTLLAPEDAQDIYLTNMKARDKKVQESKDKDLAKNREFFTNLVKDAERMVNPRNKFGFFDDENIGQQKSTRLYVLMNSWYDSYAENNEGHRPSLEDIHKKSLEVVKQVRDEFALMEDGGGYSPTSTSPNPNTPSMPTARVAPSKASTLEKLRSMSTKK